MDGGRGRLPSAEVVRRRLRTEGVLGQSPITRTSPNWEEEEFGDWAPGRTQLGDLWWDTPARVPLSLVSAVRTRLAQSGALVGGGWLLGMGALMGFALCHALYTAHLFFMALQFSAQPFTVAAATKALQFARLELAAGHVGSSVGALLYSPRMTVVLDVRVVAALFLAPFFAQLLVPLARIGVAIMSFLFVGDWNDWSGGARGRGGGFF